MKKSQFYRMAAIAAAITVAATGCSAAGGGTTSSAPAGSLTFRANGTPILTGKTISLGIAAGNPVPGDSTNNLMANTLTSWGATVNYTIGATNSTELAVIAGQLQATDGPLPILADAGLIIIAPAMTHVDDVLVSSSVSNVAGLKGKQVGVIASTDPSTYLLDQLVSKQKWTAADLPSVYTNSDSNAVSELIAGKIPAAFVASEDLPTLKQNGNFKVLATAATIAPEYADSFNGATAVWAKANPDLVEAIDLAWWHAAYVFNNDTAAWDKNALAYTKNAASADVVAQERVALAAFNPWPSDPAKADDALSLATIKTNYDASNAAGFIKGPGAQSPANLVDLAPWQASTVVAKKYPKEY